MAVISFDLDGVLQRNPFHGRSPHGLFGYVRRQLAPYMGMADLQAAEVAALDLVFGEHHDRLYAGRLVDAHDWDGIIALVAQRLGHPGGIDMAALTTEWCTKPNIIFLYNGGAETLHALRTAGHTLVTITNGFRCYQEPVIRALGIYDYFTAMVTPEAAGYAKPETGIYRAAEQYGPGPYIHVGDVMPHDIAGANRAGWKSIYIVQPQAPAYTEMPSELKALAPWERPAQGKEWLTQRLEIDRKWHGFPPATLEECIPDAIVEHLSEIPATVAAIAAAG